MTDAISFDDVCSAGDRLNGIVHVTPVATSRTLDALSGRTVFLKCENLQRVGAFKFRGAYNMMHLQETFSDVVKTDKTGLSKTAHTRWMISAFANFLPGSTIFRLA